jgi:hypothetical protein
LFSAEGLPHLSKLVQECLPRRYKKGGEENIEIIQERNDIDNLVDDEK